MLNCVPLGKRRFVTKRVCHFRGNELWRGGRRRGEDLALSRPATLAENEVPGKNGKF